MRETENTKTTIPADGDASPSPRPRLGWSRLLLYAGLMLLSLVLTGSFLRPDQCETRGCSPYVATGPLLDGELLSPDAFRATTQGQTAHIWLEFGETGVFTPTDTGGGTVIETDAGQTIPYLDDLATKGYLAIRVPHAPPTYTQSSLLPGILPFAPDPLVFSYYSPPATDTLTTVPVSLTRRADLEAIVKGRYPIADGQSHWEVWWLPEGETFPIPDGPFRLEAGDDPLALRFRVDFGSGTDARDCAGCPIEVLFYNGYLFAGPYRFALRYLDGSLQDPLVSFGVHCAYQSTPVYPTVGQYITPTVPFSHVHCLENWDVVSRTFTIDVASSQGWDYAYYWQETGHGATPQPAGDPPFDVEVGPLTGGGMWSEPGMLGLVAVHTPTLVISDTLREMFHITATSRVSPEVEASSLSIALAPGYTLDEEVQPPPTQYRIYLPLVVRDYP